MTFKSRATFHALLFLSALTLPARASDITTYRNFPEAFGYDPKSPPKSFTLHLTNSTSPGTVFWPGEDATLTFQILNKTDQPLKAAGKWELIQYATRCSPEDPLSTPTVLKLKDIAAVPVSVDLPAKGFANLTAKLPLPAEFGAYAVVLNLEGHGRVLAATCVRALKPTPGKVQYPAYAVDIQNPDLLPVFQRTGVKGTRQEWGYFNPDEPKNWERLDAFMKAMHDADVTVMLTLSTGGDGSKMPLGAIRGYLNEKDQGKMEYPGDFAFLPKYDPDFQRWCKLVAERYGWPKGPLNAVELWNEPWEGMSISGWGADMPRYRELYLRMALGVEEARKSANVQVLIGGACSSMNTEDKLFGDNDDEPFLKYLDFTSIHYQPMCAQPALIKRFRERKHPLGPTRVWDTESWIANSEDRVAGVVASMRAIGQERTAGVLHDCVREGGDVTILQEGGAKPTRAFVNQALAPAAAIAAMQQFMGERPFKELLFKNGLPWVFVFQDPAAPDDGTVVVLGDLGALYERDQLLFRGVLGVDARKRSRQLRPKLAALPATATDSQRQKARDEVRLAEVLDNATLTIADPANQFASYDFYGNKSPAQGKLTIPLNGFGYFVRADGKPGSFANLLDAIRSARIDGYEPVEMVARDLTARVDAKPALRLTITNVLNRPVAGKLTVKLGALQLDAPNQDLSLAAHETKELSLRITAGQPTPDNTYALAVTFDAGPDGRRELDEPLHVNVIPRKTITVDGNLDDWKDVLPQPVRGTPGAARNLTEKAWLPFGKFDESAGAGYASGFMAYDDKGFYFAAKIADATPYEGNIRFAERNDDEYFYPEIAHDLPKKDAKPRDLKWPEGVRRFTYRKDPALPSATDTDNVQLGFNVLPIEQTDWLPFPPGTMPRFETYKTTDYEYALNPVSEKHGGGAELWRLLAPGVPRKHYYPRQPKAPKDGGPVPAGQLVMKRDGNTRLVECMIPWSELPDVKAKLDANQPIKFTFRVNDNKGPAYELNTNRSVSKADTYALHNYWQTSWAVETEFAFEK